MCTKASKPPATDSIPLGNATKDLYRIYGDILQEPYTLSSVRMSSLIQNSIIRCLSNETVIPVRVTPSQNLERTILPFPCFVAETLRRMRSPGFTCFIAMRYILNSEPQIRDALKRLECGWCLSGVYGCDHFEAPERSIASRFYMPRIQAKNSSGTSPASAMPSTLLPKSDRLAILTDPRKTFLGALIVATKFHQDRHVSNRDVSSKVGITLDELNKAETAITEALKWNLNVKISRKDAETTWLYDVGHGSFAEPLFPFDDNLVTKYGVKELREKHLIPPPTTSFISQPTSSITLVTAVNTGVGTSSQVPLQHRGEEDIPEHEDVARSTKRRRLNE